MKLGQKIIVVGCPGSGKSTLSKELRDVTGLPLFHLDNIWLRSTLMQPSSFSNRVLKQPNG